MEKGVNIKSMFDGFTNQQQKTVNTLADIEYHIVKMCNKTTLGSKAYKRYCDWISALNEAKNAYCGVPRLLTFEELKEEKCHPVHWYQSRQQPYNNEYAQVYFSFDVLAREYGCSIVRPGTEKEIWEKIEDYGKEWRCWTGPVYNDVPWDT